MLTTIIAPSSQKDSYSDDYRARLDSSDGTVILQVRSTWKRHFKTAARCTIADFDAHLAHRGCSRDTATHGDLWSIAMTVRIQDSLREH